MKKSTEGREAESVIAVGEKGGGSYLTCSGLEEKRRGKWGGGR